MTANYLAKYRSFVVPAGKYFLCDPCYVIDTPSDWMRFLNKCADKDDSEYDLNGDVCNGHYEELPEGTKVLAFATSYGDGTYTDQHGNQYPVDSGLLGLVPFKYAPDTKDIDKFGKIIEFGEETLCFTKDGILTFGSYIIDTEE